MKKRGNEQAAAWFQVTAGLKPQHSETHEFKIQCLNKLGKHTAIITQNNSWSLPC